MDIAWFRDLVIVVCGIMSFLVLAAILIMMVALFRRFSGIMDSLKVTAKNIEELSISARNEIISPLARIGAIIKGISRGVEAVSGIFRRK
jgi:hypothetical protein